MPNEDVQDDLLDCSCIPPLQSGQAIILHTMPLGAKNVSSSPCGNHLFPGAHTKLAASLVSPEPLYLAMSGYAQRGRVIFTPFSGLESSTYFVAMTWEGATPFSTHCSRAL